MGRDGMSRVMVMRSLRWVVAVVLAAVASALWAPVAHAAGSAGLTVAVTGPTTAPSGSTFSYTILIRNLGPDAADGATFEVAPPSGSSAVAAACTTASGGAACPGTIGLAPGSVSGTLPTLPVNGSVTLTVTGTYGSGSSATVAATVAVPVGFVDPNPSTNTSTLTTVLVGPAAHVSVSTSVDAATAPFGQTVTYATSVTNSGPDDVVGLQVQDHFHSLRVGAQNGLDVTGALSCDTSAANAAPCPASLTAPVAYTGVLTGSDLPVTWPALDLPAGKTLYLKVAVAFKSSHCGTFEVRQVVDVVQLVAPTGTSLTGATSAVSPQITLGPCTDVAIQVATSAPAPRAGQPMTTTVTVSSSAAGSLTDVPFVVQLPDQGGLAVDPTKVPPVCAVGSGRTACPHDLTYDLATRTIRGTIAVLAAGGRFSLSLDGTAGLVPASGYTIRASIPGDGGAVSSASAVTYQVSNSKAKVSMSFTVQGAVSPHALAFRGIVTCAQQGRAPFTVTIPAGQSRATTTIGSALWLGDVCTAAVTSIPAAPEGYAWAGRSAPHVEVSSVTGMRLGEFTFVLGRIPPVPSTDLSPTSAAHPCPRHLDPRGR